MAVANDTRGGDSWGFWNTDHLMKGLGDISNVAVKTVKSQVVMAHTRKATTGATTVPNAHPFAIGDIIGAHNGMISNHTELNTKYNRNYEVDSMHLFGHLAEGKTFEDIYGYGAIEFIRKNESRSRIYLCKLSGGDLTVCGIGKDADNYQGVLWSSNGAHLEQALKTAGIENFKFEIKTGQIYTVYQGTFGYSVQDKVPQTLELGTRNYGGGYQDWNNRHQHGVTPDYSQNNGPKTKLTPEEYNQMLEGMTDEEEKAFFELWAKETGMEFEEMEEEEVEEAEIIEVAGTKAADEDWADEHKLINAGHWKDGKWIPLEGPTKEAIASAVAEMGSNEGTRMYDTKTNKWVSMKDGTMSSDKENS